MRVPPTTLLLLLVMGASCAADSGFSTFEQAREALLGPEVMVDSPVVQPAAVSQANLALASNGTQWMAAWGDQRMSNNGGSQIWGTRISAAGVPLDAYGLQLTYGRGGDHPAVACLPAYCWVTWTDYDSVEGVRVSAAGTILDSTVVTLTGSTGVTSDLSMASNGVDFFLAWTDTRSGVAAIYGLPVLGDGGTSTESVVSSGALARQRPAVVGVPGGFLVAWTDARTAVSHIWAVPVLDAGTVLGTEVQVSSGSSSEGFAAGAVEDGGTVLLTWDDAVDVSARRVTPSGGPVDMVPLVIDSSAGTQRHPRVAFDGAQWVVIYESGTGVGLRAVHRDGTLSGLYALDAGVGSWPAVGGLQGAALVGWNGQHLAGGVTRVDSGVPVLSVVPLTPAVSANSQFDTDVAGTDGGFLVVWQDSRTNALMPMARWFDATGTAAGSSFALSAKASLANLGRAAVGGPAQVLTMWLDPGSSLLVSRVPALGAPLDSPGVSLGAGLVQGAPAGAFGPGQYLVAFEERHVSTEIHAQLVPLLGSPVSGSTTVYLSTTNGATPAVGGNGTQWLVAWSELGGTQIGYARINAAGAVLDATPLAMPGGPSTRTTPSVASDGTNFLVAWFDTSTSVVFVRVAADGSAIDPAPVVLATGLSSGTVPTVTWDGLRYLVSWRSAGAVVSQAVPPVGAPLGAPMTLMSSALSHRSAALAFTGSDALLVSQTSQPQAPVASMRGMITHFSESSTASVCTVSAECRSFECDAGLCVPVDSGAPDGGADAGVDAGVDAGNDAGEDAGVDAGGMPDVGTPEAADAGLAEDAGQGEPRTLVVGCGCASADAAGWCAVLLIALWRRRR